MLHELILIALSVGSSVAAGALWKRQKVGASVVLFIAATVLVVLLAQQWHVNVDGL